MKKNVGQGNKRALKEKEIEVSVEILKKIEGYVIKNYLYLKNVEVSIANRQSTDKLPTDYQQSADRSLKPWKKTVGQLSADCSPTVGRQSVEVNCSSQLPNFRWLETNLICI